MSWYDGVPAALLYAGPPQNYPAAAAASSAAQSLITGASGGYSQPVVPVGFWQPNKPFSVILGHLSGVITGQSTATTATISLGVSNASNTISSGSTYALVTPPAITITSLSGVGWEMDFKIISTTVGYGTTTVSTSLKTTAVLSIGSNLQAIAPPNTVTTIDSSVAQWVYATVTFSTASATNSCTLQDVIMYGMS